LYGLARRKCAQVPGKELVSSKDTWFHATEHYEVFAMETTNPATNPGRGGSAPSLGSAWAGSGTEDGEKKSKKRKEKKTRKKERRQNETRIVLTSEDV